MSTTDVLTSSGTWTCPAYVTSVWARCWAGGGSAGGVTISTTTTVTGGGGAGGAFAEVLAVAVTPGTVYTVTVGAAKTGSTGSGSAGNDSWFSSAATVLAKGGAGGSSPPADGATGVGGTGSTTGCIGDNVFAGGSGGPGFTGSTTFTGPGGGGAGSGAAGSAGSGTSGGGGGSASGGQGGNGRTTAGAGAAGSVYGGGGAAAFGTTASHSFAGGNGAPGRIELEYTPTYTPAGGGVRAATSDIVDVTAAPAIIDGLTPASGDVFLFFGPVGDTGLWQWSSTGAAMTAFTSDAAGSYRDVREGSWAGSRVFIASDPFPPPGGFSVRPNIGGFFVNPTVRQWVIQGVPGPEGYVGVCPAVAAAGSWVVPHRLGSPFLLVTIAATATPFAYVAVGSASWPVERTDLNTFTIKPAAAIAAGAYEVMIRRAV